MKNNKNTYTNQFCASNPKVVEVPIFLQSVKLKNKTKHATDIRILPFSNQTFKRKLWKSTSTFLQMSNIKEEEEEEATSLQAQFYK